MTQTTARVEADAPVDHHPPTGLRVRGTVVVVPGRGETPAAFARLGARLAADAYRVRVVRPPVVDAADLAGSLDRLAGSLTDAVEGAAPVGGPVRPLVLLGADAGAAAVAALLAGGDRLDRWWPDAVVLAGLPGRDVLAAPGDWDAELDARTACPVHRGVLSESAERGALAEPLPDALLAAAYGGSADLPRLVLVGDADPLADREQLSRAAASWPRTRLAVVRGARHDVLNDVQHRSVAAEVVTFLETLRERPGDRLVPVIDVEASAW